MLVPAGALYTFLLLSRPFSPFSESQGRLLLCLLTPTPLWFPYVLYEELSFHLTEKETEVQEIK